MERLNSKGALPHQARSHHVEATLLPDTIQYHGELNEFSNPETLRESLHKLGEVRGRVQGAKFDFAKVTRANSAGITIWLRFFADVEDRFEYVNAPVWLVNQFNMISNFLGESSIVSSFQAPFFCEETEGSLNFKFSLKDDLPVLESYSDYEVPIRKVEGKNFEPDFSPGSYFQFITKIRSRY